MTEQEAQAEQGYTEVDPFDLSDDQSDEVTALAEATVERDALARAYDPDAFTDRALDQTRHSGAVIQWAARRHLAVEAADRVIASGILAERSRVVVAAPSDTDREAAIEAVAQVMFEPPSLGQVDDPEYTWAQMVVEDPTRADMYRQDAAAALEAARFALAQPVQVEVTETMIRDALESYLSTEGKVRDAMRAALSAALGGGE